MEIPLSLPPVPVSVNKSLCHEFQSAAVCFVQDGQRDEIVSSFHRSLFSWNNSNAANSEFLQSWGHPSTFVFSRKKADYVFHHNNERFCHSEHFQKENKACADNGSVSFIAAPNPKAPSQQNPWRNKRQGLFYARLGSATPPAAPGEGSGLQQPPAHHRTTGTETGKGNLMSKGEGCKEFRWGRRDRSSWCVTAVGGKSVF